VSKARRVHGRVHGAHTGRVDGRVRSLLGGVRFYTGRVQASKARLVLVDGRVVYTDPRNTGRVQHTDRVNGRGQNRILRLNTGRVLTRPATGRVHN